LFHLFEVGHVVVVVGLILVFLEVEDLVLVIEVLYLYEQISEVFFLFAQSECHGEQVLEFADEVVEEIDDFD
jgi:hypothetical protein